MVSELRLQNVVCMLLGRSESIKSKLMKLYKLTSFHQREDYHFSVHDPKNELFDKFNFPDCKDLQIRNNTIPLKEDFISNYGLNLATFLKQYDLYSSSSGLGDLFSERAVTALQEELKTEIEFIPCSLNNELVPMFAGLFLKTAPLNADYEGMKIVYDKTIEISAHYALQDDMSGMCFVTQNFVDFVENLKLKIEFISID